MVETIHFVDNVIKILLEECQHKTHIWHCGIFYHNNTNSFMEMYTYNYTVKGMYTMNINKKICDSVRNKCSWNN